MKTALVSIFVSRLRKIPKDKQPLKNKLSDKHSHRKYRSPLERWRAIIKSVLVQQKLNKGSKTSIVGSMSCLVNETSSRPFQTSSESKLDKCGDRGRRATILSLFPTTGRSVSAFTFVIVLTLTGPRINPFEMSQ